MNIFNFTRDVVVPDGQLVVAFLAIVDGQCIERTFAVPFSHLKSATEASGLHRLTSACLDSVVERIQESKQ